MQYALDVILLLLTAGTSVAYPETAKKFSPTVARISVVLPVMLGLVAIKDFLVEYVYPAWTYIVASPLTAIGLVAVLAALPALSTVFQFFRLRPVVLTAFILLSVTIPLVYLYVPDDATTDTPLPNKPAKKPAPVVRPPLVGRGPTSQTEPGASDVEEPPPTPKHYASTTSTGETGLVCHTDGDDNVFPRQGAEVTGVTVGSIADKAGIRRNDHILKIDGTIVNDSIDCLIVKNSGGRPLLVDILRGGRVQTVLLQDVQRH